MNPKVGEWLSAGFLKSFPRLDAISFQPLFEKKNNASNYSAHESVDQAHC
jgi:hypothetical protein